MKKLLLISMVLISLSARAESELEKKCAEGDATACTKDYQAHFVGKDGVTKPDTWWNGWAKQLESSEFKLTQYFNGFAIFTHPSKEFVIGVNLKGIGKTHIGDSLKATIPYCMKFGGKVPMTTQQGLTVNVLLYEQIACPEGL